METKTLEQAELDARIAYACSIAYVERANAIARELGYSERNPMSDYESAAHPEISRLLDTADVMGAWHHNAVQLIRKLKGWKHDLGAQLDDSRCERCACDAHVTRWCPNTR